ncbi:hypothetical protein P4O66_003171 [Electrophorus voltai]|uniref:LRRNT domain-containing protein n=1 Tax=Electrophorus voltai TaxID=2609070 RepID=A0AAD9DMG3_9TELE|nr:hypothetical protein P4O66_003171 [Electrophorus voltai]
MENKTSSFTDGLQNQTQLPSTAPPATGSEICLDPQLAFIVATSSGGLILILLISTLVLTCKVIILKRQYRVRRPTRSNVDLVSGTGYWGTERTEGGIVGPCETNLLLEDVRTEGEDDEAQGSAERAALHQSTTAHTDAENVPGTMQVSTSRDSCIDPVKELENMPLVVNHRRKKKQIINSDWAGPSPFLEGSIEPNLPSEPFHQNKSKRISLHSFLPQQLSNRLAMLPEDDLHMVDVSGGCTFGRNVEDDVLAEAGKAEMEKEQIQTHHTDQSQPAASPPSDIPAAETANTPTAPAISLSIQQTPHSDETIPFTPLGNTTVAPPHFEDVDLDRALEPTAESETLPTPPPPPPPPQSYCGPFVCRDFTLPRNKACLVSQGCCVARQPFAHLLVLPQGFAALLYNVSLIKKEQRKTGAQQRERSQEDRRREGESKRKRHADKLMKKMRTANVMPVATLASLMLLLLLLSVVAVLAICPPMCSCGKGHRVVDCSTHGLSLLPDSLQHNIHSLNLSHNRLQNLDGLLGRFAHLRTLDISHNRLRHLPVGLPRALWDINASANHIRQLEKNDTAYHWNLQSLDLSNNQLERVVFINNTLPSLRALNLSHNKFWTVPTNMPHKLEVVDLSHNFLLQILPGSLDRMSQLARFYLHANRFTSLSETVFNRLEALQLLTLGDNPWACEEEENITNLLNWVQQTSAKVLGCPCYISRDAGHRPPMQAVTAGPLTSTTWSTKKAGTGKIRSTTVILSAF